MSETITAQDVSKCKRCARRKLASGGGAYAKNAPAGLEDGYRALYRLLEETVIRRKSSCCILEGGFGTGKSLVLERVLGDLAAELRSNAKASQGSTASADASERLPFSIVWLDGLLHTDETLALKAIAQQLVSGLISSAFHHSLATTQNAVRQEAAEGRAVVFVLRDFDAFARQRLRRPCFMYTLLDMVQDPLVCISIVGLARKIDNLTLLEKRVRSRFSQNQIGFHTPPSEELVVRTLFQLVSITEEEAQAAQIEAHVRTAWNKNWGQLLIDGGVGGAGASSEGSKQGTLDKYVRRWLALDRSMGWLCRLLEVAIATKTQTSYPFLTSNAIKDAVTLLCPDWEIEVLRSLNSPQLLVLIAMSRMERRQLEFYSFEATYTEYESFVRQFPTSPERFTRAALFQAFSDLLTLGLAAIVPRTMAEASNSEPRGGTSLLHVNVRMSVDPEDLLSAMDAKMDAKKLNCSTHHHQWCKQWVKK